MVNIVFGVIRFIWFKVVLWNIVNVFNCQSHCCRQADLLLCFLYVYIIILISWDNLNTTENSSNPLVWLHYWAEITRKRMQVSRISIWFTKEIRPFVLLRLDQTEDVSTRRMDTRALQSRSEMPWQRLWHKGSCPASSTSSQVEYPSVFNWLDI